MNKQDNLRRLVHWTKSDFIECATYYPDHNVLELHFSKNNETKRFYVESSVWIDLMDGKDIVEIYEDDVLGVFLPVADFGNISEGYGHYSEYDHYIIDEDNSSAHKHSLYVQTSNGYDKMLISNEYCMVTAKSNDFNRLQKYVIKPQ